jgi:hypothetical protein
MSYKYRKAKRLRCNKILEILFTQFHERVEKSMPDKFFVPLFGPIKVNNHVENQEYLGSITTLLKNGHIEFNKEMDHIAITATGVEEYKEGFYIVENRKDYLAEIEKYTKWIFPIITVVISVIALLLSLASFFSTLYSKP